MKDAIIFDGESESLNLANTRCWQFSACKIIGGKIQKGIEFFVDVPNFNISADAARITNFNRDKWNDLKVPAEQVVDYIDNNIVNSNLIVSGHNILGFDVMLLRNMYHQVGRELDFNKFIYRCVDTLAMARGRFYQIEMPEDERERLSYNYKMLHRPSRAFKGSLSAVARDFGIDFDPNRLHDALYDVFINAQVYQRLVYGTSLG